MDSLSTGGSEMKSRNFVQHMTEFDTKHKSELLNIFQYSLLMIIPVVLMNIGIGELFSSEVEDKTLLELSVEIVGELFVIVVGLYFIHRFVTYIPTYSETPYSPVNFITIISVIVLVLFTFQTHLNEKMRVVLERVYAQVSGNTSPVEEEKKVVAAPQVHVSQPIAKPAQDQTVKPVVQPPPAQPPMQENMVMYGQEPVAANAGGFAPF